MPQVEIFHDALPLMESVLTRSSLAQLYKGLSYLVEEHEEVVEILQRQGLHFFTSDTRLSHFGYTNFCFETGHENGLHRKRPSKEHRFESIVSMRTPLDVGWTPLDTSDFSGDESERPLPGDVISPLKRRHAISVRSVRVADKGLNWANNVTGAVLLQRLRTLQFRQDAAGKARDHLQPEACEATEVRDKQAGGEGSQAQAIHGEEV